MGGRERERDRVGSARERARACAAGSACSPAGAWSISAEGRPSGGSVEAAPLKRHAHVPSARSVAVSCVQTRHRPVLHHSLHGGPDNALDVAITTPRQRPAVPPIPSLGVAFTGTPTLLTHALARTHMYRRPSN